MKTYIIDKDKFPDFVKLIQTKGRLYGPVKRKEKYSFEEVKNFEELDFDYQRTVISVKKFLTPPRYETLKYTKEAVEHIIPDDEKTIVIGVHPCDIHGVKILDRLFLGNIKDPYYAKRRKNLIIIGHSCLPDDKCFCNATGTDMVEDGFDLFLTELENYYLLWVGSDEGLAFAIAAEELLYEDISDDAIREYVNKQQRRSEMFTTNIPYFKYMADVIHLLYDSEVWDEFGKKCLSCGTCSLVCPTCNCFNVDDKILISREEGVRERMLDSCTLPFYSKVAGGHDFRPTRTSRLKLYYTHKLKEYMGKWGAPGCVGCGRCVQFCPVDINVLTVSEALFNVVCKTKEVRNL